MAVIRRAIHRVFCWLGVHDWRLMDGVCCECGYNDPLWIAWFPPPCGDEDPSLPGVATCKLPGAHTGPHVYSFENGRPVRP